MVRDPTRFPKDEKTRRFVKVVAHLRCSVALPNRAALKDFADPVPT
jgi:hypothetical protein